jgi:hypothetical protein
MHSVLLPCNLFLEKFPWVEKPGLQADPGHSVQAEK